MFSRIIILCFIATFTYSSEIKSVDFLQEGEVSKLVLKVDSGTVAQQFHNKQDKQIVLDVRNATAQPHILRGIDTSEFSGSVVYIQIFSKPNTKNTIRFALQLRDNVRSFLENKGDQIILNVENRFGAFDNQDPRKEIANTKLNNGKISRPKSTSIVDILENVTLSGKKEYLGKTISINAVNMSMADLLSIIADASGFNIILDQAEITKLAPLSLNLTAPWDQILDTVFDLRELVGKRHNNILFVTTKAKAEGDILAEIEREKKAKENEPLVSKIFPISFARLDELTPIIQPYITPDRGSLAGDPRNNYLIVQDTVEVVERIEALVKELDKKTPQVIIEGKIIEVSDTHRKDIGLTNGIGINYQFSGRSGGFANRSGVFDISGTGGTAIGTTIANLGRLVNLNFNLSLLEEEDKAKIVSSPKVITKHNEQATLTNSTTTNFVATQQSVAGAQDIVTEITADISLQVTPQVTNEGSISMRLDIQKGSLVPSGDAATPPGEINNQIQTDVLVGNGETLMIGGLYRTDISKSHTGIPVLKNLPFIGWLFRSSYNPTNSKAELLIFITPTILEGSKLTTLEGN